MLGGGYRVVETVLGMHLNAARFNSLVNRYLLTGLVGFD
jgi:hypothetical protein